MTKQEAYFRIKVARSAEVAGLHRAEATPPEVERSVVRFEMERAPTMERATPPAAAAAAVKVCSGHFRKQIAATRKDGRPYACSFEKNCVFGHPSVSGKSNDQLVEMATAMPSSVKQDFLRAIGLRKK